MDDCTVQLVKQPLWAPSSYKVMNSLGPSFGRSHRNVGLQAEEFPLLLLHLVHNVIGYDPSKSLDGHPRHQIKVKCAVLNDIFAH